MLEHPEVQEAFRSLKAKSSGSNQRKTWQGVLDGRTLRMLERLQRWGLYDQLYGTISTGKEANVYYATLSLEATEPFREGAPACTQRAIKVFKTSALSFRDRTRYVNGDFRFRNGYQGSRNVRKMVVQWSEKEFRNLRRIASEGLRCPLPIEIKGHVLVMRFLGREEGHGEGEHFRPALRLHALLKPSGDKIGAYGLGFWRRMYIEVIVMMRELYQRCKLVHGDLSSFNILFHQGHPHLIDVSQAVEEEHPEAMAFLRRDCLNITRFFEQTLGVAEKDSDSDGSGDLHEEKNGSEMGEAVPPEWGYLQDDETWRQPILPLGTLLEFVADPNFPCLSATDGQELFWPEFDREAFAKSLQEEAEALNHSLTQMQKNAVTSGEDDKGAELEAGFRVIKETRQKQGKANAADTQLVANIRRRRVIFSAEHMMFERENISHLCAMTHIALRDGLWADRASNDLNNEALFMSNHRPTSLQELVRFEDLEDELERELKGEGRYTRLLKSDSSVSSSSLGESDSDTGERERSSESSASDDEGVHDSVPLTAEEVRVLVESSGGRIPEGYARKDWCRIVKQYNKEKRVLKALKGQTKYRKKKKHTKMKRKK